jgi:chromosome segregation ATPase
MAQNLVHRLQKRREPALPLFGVALGEPKKTEFETKGAAKRRKNRVRPKTSGDARDKVHRKRYGDREAPGHGEKKGGRDFAGSEIAQSSARQQNDFCRKKNTARVLATTEFSKMPKLRAPIGDEFWVSEATENSIAQYAKADAAKAAEIWMLSQASQIVGRQAAESAQTPAVRNNQLLDRLGLSRKGLMQVGLSHDTIERVYRALYVYSQGFHEMLDEVRKSCTKSQGPSVVSKLWETFNALLEQCEDDGYSTAMASMEKGYKMQRELVTKSYEKRLEDLECIKRKILSDLDTKTKECDDREATIVREKSNVIDLNNKIEELSRERREAMEQRDTAEANEVKARVREGQAMTESRKQIKENSVLKQRLIDEDSRIRIAASEIRSVQREREDALKREKMAKSRIAKLEMENGTLSKKLKEGLAVVERSVRDRTSESQRADNLERQLMILQQHDKKSTRMIRTLEASKSNLERRLEMTENRVKALVVENSDLQKEVDAGGERREELADELKTYKDDLDHARQENVQKNVELKLTADAQCNLKDQLTESEREVSKLKGTVRFLREAKQNLEREAQEAVEREDHLKTERQHLQDEIDRKDKEQNEKRKIIDRRNETIDKLEKRRIALQKTIEDSKRNMLKLEGDVLKQMQDMGRKMMDNEDEVKAAKVLYDTRDTERTALKGEVDRLRKSNDQAVANQQTLRESKESFRYRSVGNSRIVSLAEDMAEFFEGTLKVYRNEIQSILKKCAKFPYDKLAVARSGAEGLDTIARASNENSRVAFETLDRLHSVDLEGFEEEVGENGEFKIVNPQILKYQPTLQKIRERFMQRAKQSLDEQIRIAALLTEVDGEIQKVGRFLFRQVERERFQAEKQLKSKARKTEQKTAATTIED